MVTKDPFTLISFFLQSNQPVYLGDTFKFITLQQDIGLNSSVVDGFSFLGTMVIIGAFTSMRSLPDSKKDLIAATTSPPMMDQNFFKEFCRITIRFRCLVALHFKNSSLYFFLLIHLSATH